MALVSEGAWLYIMLTKRVALNTSSIHNMWLILWSAEIKDSVLENVQKGF